MARIDKYVMSFMSKDNVKGHRFDIPFTALEFDDLWNAMRFIKRNEGECSVTVCEEGSGRINGRQVKKLKFTKWLGKAGSRIVHFEVYACDAKAEEQFPAFIFIFNHAQICDMIHCCAPLANWTFDSSAKKFKHEFSDYDMEMTRISV